ncbi:MAG: hypothetical protein Q8K61_02955 [Gallionella sp.]|jgi:hypothetical protein|nr:hypothetical protein [Gallionella sp.]
MGLAARRLNPMFNINDNAVVMSAAQLAGVSLRDLGGKVVALKNSEMKLLPRWICC